MQESRFKDIFLGVLREEAKALFDYDGDLSQLDSIIDLLLGLEGKVAITGVGKSGLVAQKIAATLSSTGTPSIFIHPTEAMHGDLGMLGARDCVIAISYSGESGELRELLPHIRRAGIPIVTLSKSKESSLSKLGDYFIPLSMEKEACPLQVAPTTSTTLTLAIGDAIAICLMKAREFGRRDFALFHPGGSLGRELFVGALDLMQSNDLPVLDTSHSLKEAIVVMTRGRLGTALFVDSAGRLLGVLSDGDLRRAMFHDGFSLESSAFDYASKTPKTIGKNALASEALRIMRTSKIQILPIVDDSCILLGVIHLQALLQAGF